MYLFFYEVSVYKVCLSYDEESCLSIVVFLVNAGGGPSFAAFAVGRVVFGPSGAAAHSRLFRLRQRKPQTGAFRLFQVRAS